MLYEGKERLWIAGQGFIVDDAMLARETATAEWASSHVIANPANSYILGRFVEADKPNQNKQQFAMDDLIAAKPSIAYAPMNINHSARNVVGTFVATEMMYPKENELNAHIEALSAFWKYYFPDEFGMVQRAHDAGQLFYSMECVPSEVSSVGGTDDSIMYPYAGRTSPTYPQEINERSCEGVMMHSPHFVGGALVIPPSKPGWTKADVKQISQFVHDEIETVERLYDGVRATAPHLSEKDWEGIIGELILMENSRDFNADARKKAAKSGAALPDGSFPIENEGDLKNAIQAIGRAKDPAAAKAHIKSRAKSLGLSNLIPSEWSASYILDDFDRDLIDRAIDISTQIKVH